MATAVRNTHPLVASLRDAINDLKKQIGAAPPATWRKSAADAAAGTATGQFTFFVASAKTVLKQFDFVPAAALTADGTNNATLTIRRRDADGANPVTVCTLVTDVAGGNWVAFEPKPFGALSNATLEAGQQLTLEIAKGGTGVVVPAGELRAAAAHLDKPAYSITSADSSSLATALTLVNEMRAVQVLHRADTLAHKAADAATITAPAATDLATAQTLANELKADHNTHIASVTLHFAKDSLNTIAAADATNQATLDTLLNELKTDMNAHFGSAPSAPSLDLVAA